MSAGNAEDQVRYVLTSLSSVNAGVVDTVDNLQQHAVTNLTNGLADSDIQHVIGTWKLAWGPATYTKNPNGAASVTDNTMYAATGQLGGDDVCFIAVAGTNLVSIYGWFTEDFGVGTLVSWPPSYLGATAGSSSPGSISQGTDDGLSALWQMQDPTTKASIHDFVKSLGGGVKVLVGGHSLGGALCPALALALVDSGAATAVSAYPTAGPSPGDGDFATYAASRYQEFKSWKNTNDIIPLAWTDLPSAQDIYDSSEFKTCTSEDGPQPAGPVVRGILKYLEAQPPTLTTYARIGTDSTFTGNPMHFSMLVCHELNHDWTDVGKKLKPLLTNADFVSIYKYMAGTTDDPAWADLEAFVEFLAQMAYQHTSAYSSSEGFDFSHALTDAIKRYVSIPKTTPTEDAEFAVIETLLSNVASFLT